MTRHRSPSDRGVSVAVTHVLAIGITAVLIGVLFVGVGSLVETQTDRSAETSLETIGERLSGQLSSAEHLEADVRATHPTHVSGMGYTIEVLDEGDCREAPLLEGRHPCLYMTATGANVEVYVPVRADVVTDVSVRGGSLEMIYVNGEVELQEAS